MDVVASISRGVRLIHKTTVFVHPDGEDSLHAYRTRVEQQFVNALSSFSVHIKSQATASILLFLCTITALVWASSANHAVFHQYFINTPIGFHIANNIVEMPLYFWVNDILLAIFFFLVGLEIKREFLVGELSDKKQAYFVFFAAFGGMFMPALIYYLVNFNFDTRLGWGIPMATDTAFALGVLCCFRHKIPKGIFTFLAALAIVDDIGAIIVIAVFYTKTFYLNLFLIAMSLCLLLLLLNLIGIRRAFPYLVIGMLVWFFLEEAGIHGTLAGILVAFLIPARPKLGPKFFIKRTQELLARFEQRKKHTPLILEDQQQHEVLEQVKEIALESTTPLQYYTNKLKLPVALFVLPLFALVNAGIPVNFQLMREIFIHPVSLGIFFGLVLGKPLGVLLFSRIAIATGFGRQPKDSSLLYLVSAAILTGIGFTMSLFITNISFYHQASVLVLAKAAILLGSLVAILAGVGLLMAGSYIKQVSGHK